MISVITVSREYGAGGGELARLLAQHLGWELLDQQLLHAAAALEQVSDEELERVDEKALGVAERFGLHAPHYRYLQGLTAATQQAAARGKVVLVGRGTRQLLADTPGCLHLRLVAPREWRAARMAALQGWTLPQAVAQCIATDRSRQRFTRYFFGPDALAPSQYDLVVNSSRVPLADVVDAVVMLVTEVPWDEPLADAQTRVLTLARELGAGDTGFAPTLAERLALRVYDRDLLEHEAQRLGVPQAELEKIDEQPAGIFQRFRPGSLHQRYFETLGQLMRSLAEQGGVLLVGRGGSRFLREHASAFHVRLTATAAVRLRRVMEHRWLREGPARALIAETDERRTRFYRDYFGADWSDPLEYHLTVNTGRLGANAVDVTAFLANRCWSRAGQSARSEGEIAPGGGHGE